MPTAAVVRDWIKRRLPGKCPSASGNVCVARMPVKANALTTALFGDSTSTHVLMLEFAHQQGLLPLSDEVFEIAIDSAVPQSSAAVRLRGDASRQRIRTLYKN